MTKMEMLSRIYLRKVSFGQNSLISQKQLKKSVSFRFEVYFCYSEVWSMVYSTEIPELLVVQPSYLHSSMSEATLETVYLK